MTIPVLPNSAARALFSFASLAALSLSCINCPAQDPPQFNDLAARAAAARDQQNAPLAIQLYTQAEQLKPDWQEGWWYLGVLQYSSNQYPGAIDAFSHLLQLAPTAVPAMALRGLCEFEIASYDDSLRDLEQAVAHGALNEPRNEQVIRYHLAQLLTRAGRFQDALDHYRYFATQHIDAPDILVGIGLAGMRNPSFPKDVPTQDRELYEATGNAGYVFLSGDNEKADKSGVSEKADDLFSHLFAQYPSTPNLHYFYGFLLFPHAPELAIDQFSSELAVNPSNETARAMLAFTLVIAGRFAEAVQPAQGAYANAPDSEIAQLALGRSLAETGDMKRGIELLNQVLAHDPNNLEAHLGLVSIYSRSGSREQAERERNVCRELAK